MFSKTTTYVMRALAVLAKAPEGAWVGTSTLAETTGAPENYLGKLLQSLTRAKVIESRKGAGGGIRFARDPHTISLFEALDPFEDFDKWPECMFGMDPCIAPKPCSFHDRWVALREDMLKFLHDRTAGDLATHLSDAREDA